MIQCKRGLIYNAATLCNIPVQFLSEAMLSKEYKTLKAKTLKDKAPCNPLWIKQTHDSSTKIVSADNTHLPNARDHLNLPSRN